MIRTCVSARSGASSFTKARSSGASFGAACARQREADQGASTSEQKTGSNPFRMNHSESGRLTGVGQFMHPAALKQGGFTGNCRLPHLPRGPLCLPPDSPAVYDRFLAFLAKAF